MIDAVAAGFPAAVGALGRLVRIPSVAFSGFPDEPLVASAEAVAQLLRDTGAFELVEVRRATYPVEGGPTEEGTATGSPAVVARRRAAPAVRPCSSTPTTTCSPRAATSSGRPRRSSRRSKATASTAGARPTTRPGVVTHVAAITAALEALGDDLGVGIAIFIEGEEEAGSRRSTPSSPRTTRTSPRT